MGFLTYLRDICQPALCSTGYTSYMSAHRSILHVDMDAFFASVEMLDRPELAGKPVLVGYDGPRGVVAAASYEARAFGCHSAQPMSVAKRLCPHAVICPVRGARYREMSERVFALFDRYTPRVEPLSIDEAFLDLTGAERAIGAPAAAAARLKSQIRAETGLAASIGVAPNKFLAKLASDLRKPDGLAIITVENLRKVLDPLPIRRLWGVGPKTAARLNGLGIRTIGELHRLAPNVLARRIGFDEAEHYLRLARGEDERPVVGDHDARSIGQEQTFGENLADPAQVRDVILEQCEQVARRLRRHGLQARSVTVKIRFGDFRTVTRRCTLENPSDATVVIWRAAGEQFDRWATKEFQSVRLIGVTAGDLAAGAAAQLDLFANPDMERQRRLDGAMDRITSRFGGAAIRRARESWD